VDSDLGEAILALRKAFQAVGSPASFGEADRIVVGALKNKLALPRRYQEFLLSSDPLQVESLTPSERVRLIPSAELEEEQIGYALGPNGESIENPKQNGWRPSWIIIGISSLLGDPYFLDVAQIDPEGDCPVFTAMSGTDVWQPRLCASSFAMFLRILAVTMEVAQGFDLYDYDADNEHVFREAIGPKIREYDPAALKGGHWT
jgi:hypothetical protein